MRLMRLFTLARSSFIQRRRSFSPLSLGWEEEVIHSEEEVIHPEEEVIHPEEEVIHLEEEVINTFKI